MQTSALVGLVGFALVAGCGGGPAEDASLSPSPTPTASGVPASSSFPDGSAVPTRPVTINVRGTVTTGRDLVPGRPVHIVDATGLATSTMTDAAGVFHADNVVAPYDLRVEEPGEKPGVSYLGVHRSDVRVYASPDAATTSPEWPRSTIQITLSLAVCPTTYCSIDFQTKSAHGHGGLSSGYNGATTSLSSGVDHDFQPSTSAENVDIYALVVNRDSTRYWFVRGSAFVTPGQNTSLTMQPVELATLGNVTVTGNDANVPSTWRRDLNVWANIGGATLQLGRIDARSLVLRVPNIPGSELSAALYVSAPDAGTPNGNRDTKIGWSGSMPLLSPTINLPPLDGVEPVAPSRDGVMPSSATRFEWKKTSASGVAVFNVDNAMSVMTEEATVDFARLERLGVARPVVGKHVVSLYSLPTLLDQQLDSDYASEGWSKPGSETSTSFEYTVTP